MEKDLLRFGDENATHRLIMLHGWGADADDLLPLGKAFVKDIGVSFEVCSLNAPEDHPEGIGRQWYGLFPPDWGSVSNSVDQLQSRLKILGAGKIPLENSFLFGFSQGGAMALSAGCELPVAGLIASSAYPHPEWNPSPKGPNILLTHGKKDETVPPHAADKISTELASKDYFFELCWFDGGHEIPPHMFTKFQDFIKTNIK